MSENISFLCLFVLFPCSHFSLARAISFLFFSSSFYFGNPARQSYRTSKYIVIYRHFLVCYSSQLFIYFPLFTFHKNIISSTKTETGTVILFTSVMFTIIIEFPHTTMMNNRSAIFHVDNVAENNKKMLLKIEIISKNDLLSVDNCVLI